MQDKELLQPAAPQIAQGGAGADLRAKLSKQRECENCKKLRPAASFRRPLGAYRNWCEVCWEDRKSIVTPRVLEPVSKTVKDLCPFKRAEQLHAGAKSRAKKKGISFTLGLDWVYMRIANGYCEVTGLPFLPYSRKGWKNPFSASIDRIDPRQGYDPDNCRMVVWIYNQAKGTGTDAEVRIMCKWLLGVQTDADRDDLLAIEDELVGLVPPDADPNPEYSEVPKLSTEDQEMWDALTYWMEKAGDVDA